MKDDSRIRGKILFRWDQAHHPLHPALGHAQVKDTMENDEILGPLQYRVS
jgi:hypothetical protein